MSRVRPDLNYASTTYGPPRGIRRPRRPISPAVRRYLLRKLQRQRNLFNRGNRRYIREQNRMTPEMRSRIAELRRRQQEQIMRSRAVLQPRLQQGIIPGTPEYEAQQQRIANMPQELKDLRASLQQKQMEFQKRRMQDPEFIAFSKRQQEFSQRQQSNPEYQELQRAAMEAQRQGRPFVPNEAQKRTQLKIKMESDLFERQMRQDPFFAKMQFEDANFRNSTRQENELFTRRMQEYMTPTPPRDEQLKQRLNDHFFESQQDLLKRLKELKGGRGSGTGGGQRAERNPHIQPDFFNSPEYKEHSKIQMGTADMYYSPYFGQQGSGSIGRGLDRAYEAWANRTGNEAVKGPPRTVRIPDKNVPTPAPALPMPPPTTVSPPKRRTGPPRTKPDRTRRTHGDPPPTRRDTIADIINKRRRTHGDPMKKRRDPRPKLTDGSTYANPYDPRKGDNYNMIAQMPATPGPSAPVQTRPAKQMDIPTNKVLARLPSDFEPLPTVESQMKDLLGPKASNALAKNQVIYGKSDPQNEPAWAKAAREKAKDMITRRTMYASPLRENKPKTRPTEIYTNRKDIYPTGVVTQ